MSYGVASKSEPRKDLEESANDLDIEEPSQKNHAPAKDSKRIPCGRVLLINTIADVKTCIDSQRKHINRNELQKGLPQEAQGAIVTKGKRKASRQISKCLVYLFVICKGQSTTDVQAISVRSDKEEENTPGISHQTVQNVSKASSQATKAQETGGCRKCKRLHVLHCHMLVKNLL